MYRLLLYCLLVLVAAGSVLGSLGVLPYSGLSILVSAGVLVAASYASNRLFASILKVSVNKESDLISGLILALIMTPTSSVHGLLVLVAVATVAMGSKYLLVWHSRHIFNPAAFGAFAAGFIFKDYASWWIGTPSLLPVAIVVGLLILRRVQRFQLALCFGGVFLAVLAIAHPASFANLAQLSLTHSAIVFFATVMLTEPMTAPKSRPVYLAYAALVSMLYATPQIGLFGFAFGPEVALLIGNAFSFIVAPSRRLSLRLVSKRREAEEVYGFTFHPEQPIKFRAGQYMEWSLPHKPSDSRGSRRFFTLSSAPTEENLSITLRIPNQMSSYKRALASLKPGESIQASELAGSFTLPQDSSKKLAFIAGGIGVTPYVSMIKYLADTGDSRDIQLLYSAANKAEFAFEGLFKSAQRVGVNTAYTVTGPNQLGWDGLRGKISASMIQEVAPDYRERIFYVSGPLGFVQTVRAELKSLGIPKRRIRQDYFPGYE
jgi:ferredoxin-NADP reductase